MRAAGLVRGVRTRALRQLAAAGVIEVEWGKRGLSPWCATFGTRGATDHIAGVVAPIICGIMIPHKWRGRRSLKFMPKRGIDADGRVFFDEFVSLAAARLKATRAITS